MNTVKSNIPEQGQDIKKCENCLFAITVQKDRIPCIPHAISTEIVCSCPSICVELGVPHWRPERYDVYHHTSCAKFGKAVTIIQHILQKEHTTQGDKRIHLLQASGTIDKPVSGDKRRAREIGFKGGNAFTWQGCRLCGKETTI